MKSNKRYLLVAIALLLATLLISGLALAADADEQKVTIKSIKFNASSYTADLENGYASLYFYPGKEDPETKNNYTFTVETDPADASLNDFRFLLTSSDTKVAYAGEQFVYGRDVGTTDLVVKALDRSTGKELATSAKVTATFKEVPVTEIVYNAVYGNPLELGINAEGTFGSDYYDDIVTILPNTATYSSLNTLTWSTSDASILRLSTKGDFKALKVGETTVKATSKGAKPVSVEFKVKVTTQPYTSVSFIPDSFTVDHTTGRWETIDNLGDYLVTEPALSIYYRYIYAKKASWSSSDPTIAYVDGYAFEPNDWEVEFGSNAGTATLTLTITNYDDTTVSTSITVTVLKDAITSIKFIKDEYTLATDDSKDLQNELIVKPDNIGYYYNGEYDLLWSSSDETVAKVDDDGDVTTKKPGTATITVKCKHDETITATTKIVVKNKTVSKVKMPETLEVSYASSTPERIEFTFEPYDAYIEDVTWVSSDATVIQLQDETNSYGNGKGYTYIYTKKAGTATVTVKVNDGTSVHEASCVVTVKKENASTLKLNKKKVTLYLHKSASDNRNVEQLYAYDKNKRYGDEDVTWSSSKKSVVSVDRQGNLTVHGKGKATITATTKDGTGLTAKCTVEVKKENLKSISGNKKITLRVGQRATLSDLYYSEMITFSPSLDKVFDDELIFKSSNRNIVSVNKKTGTLVANSVGTAEITVTSKANKKVTFTFKVKVIDAVQ